MQALLQAVCGGMILLSLGESGEDLSSEKPPACAWVRCVEHAPWRGRSGFGAVSFKDKIWVLGGFNDGTQDVDIWSSPDGYEWTFVMGPAPWVTGYYQHSAFVYDGKIWLVGGWSPDMSDKVWCSADGKNWIVAAENAALAERRTPQAVVFAGKIWVMGGLPQEGEGLAHDVWCSEDGLDWECITAHAPWRARAWHRVCAFDAKLWLIGGVAESGGYGGRYMKDIWCSKDGYDWTEITWHAPFARRRSHGLVTYAGRMWVLGGSTDKGLANDVWCSRDGVTWLKVVEHAPWEKRADFGCVVHRGSLFVIGGASERKEEDGLLNDVWRMTIDPAGSETK